MKQSYKIPLNVREIYERFATVYHYVRRIEEKIEMQIKIETGFYI
jgi:hypothetical protein